MMIKNRSVEKIMQDVSDVVPSTMFYVGAKEGSSFVFVGTYASFCEVKKFLNDYYKEAFKRCRKDSLEEAKAMFEDLAAIENREQLESKIVNGMDAISARLRLTVKYRDAVMHWKDMEKRIPVKVYKKDEDLDEKGIIIIMPGYEEGPAWFESEYLRWYKRVTKDKEEHDAKDAK